MGHKVENVHNSHLYESPSCKIGFVIGCISRFICAWPSPHYGSTHSYNPVKDWIF